MLLPVRLRTLPPPIRFETEEDHVAGVERLPKIDVDSVRHRIERRAYV
jgi:hypothetical protein